VLLPEEKAAVEIFLRHCPTAELNSERFWKKRETALAALPPHCHHNPARIYDASSVKKRLFL
jgi:hypothetical protein